MLLYQHLFRTSLAADQNVYAETKLRPRAPTSSASAGRPQASLKGCLIYGEILRLSGSKYYDFPSTPTIVRPSHPLASYKRKPKDNDISQPSKLLTRCLRRLIHSVIAKDLKLTSLIVCERFKANKLDRPSFSILSCLCCLPPPDLQPSTEQRPAAPWGMNGQQHRICTGPSACRSSSRSDRRTGLE